MTPEIYFTVALLVGIASLVVGVIDAYRNDLTDTTGMLAAGVVLAFMGAVLAGAIWPATLLVGGIVGGLKSLKWHQQRRRAQAKRQPVRQPTDYERYRAMAADQRRLAASARADGMDDLAGMQEELASQYEQTAKIYDPAEGRRSR